MRTADADAECGLGSGMNQDLRNKDKVLSNQNYLKATALT